MINFLRMGGNSDVQVKGIAESPLDPSRSATAGLGLFEHQPMLALCIATHERRVVWPYQANRFPCLTILRHARRARFFSQVLRGSGGSSARSRRCARPSKRPIGSACLVIDVPVSLLSLSGRPNQILVPSGPEIRTGTGSAMRYVEAQSRLFLRAHGAAPGRLIVIEIHGICG